MTAAPFYTFTNTEFAMGSRIDSWDSYFYKRWNTGTWTDLYYHGMGSVDVRAHNYQSEVVKLFTTHLSWNGRYWFRTQIDSIQIGVSAYGVLIDAWTRKSNIDAYGLGWIDLTLRSNYGSQTINVGSPGEVKIRTGHSNDSISVYMGGRWTYIDCWNGDDRIWLSTGIGTWIDKGRGYLSVTGSSYRSGWTNIRVAELQGGSIESRSYGNWVIAEKATGKVYVSMEGTEANHYQAKSGNADHVIHLASAGYNNVYTADGNDRIQINIGGRSTYISTGNGNDTVDLATGISTTIDKGRGYLRVAGSAYRSGWTNINVNELQGGSIESRSYGNWVIVNKATGNVYVNLEGTEGNQYQAKSGNADHIIHLTSAGYNNVYTADGNDRIQINIGGRNTYISTGNGNDSVNLSTGIDTWIDKGHGTIQIAGSAYRSGWTNIRAKNLDGNSSIQSRSYGNWVIIDRADGYIDVGMEGAEANHYEVRAGRADHNIWVSSAGYHEILTADGNDKIHVAVGGRKATISTGGGNDQVRVVNGIDVSISKGTGSLYYSQQDYLAGVVSVHAATNIVSGESRSYGLEISASAVGHRQEGGAWHGYALNWANVKLDTGINSFYGSFYGGSWGYAETRGQNFIQMTALQNTVLKDNGGNNYFMTGVQYGAVTVWTSIDRNRHGATTAELVGQKLDIFNNTDSGNQFLINNGGILGNQYFTRSGNGLIYSKTAADMRDVVSMGENANYLLNDKERKTEFRAAGSRNEIVDLGESASYVLRNGTQNAALMTKGSLDASASTGTTVHVMANLTGETVLRLGPSSTVILHGEVCYGEDSSFTLYRNPVGDTARYDLVVTYADAASHQQVSKRIARFETVGKHPETIILKAGLSGSVTVRDLERDSTVALPDLGKMSTFTYKAKAAESGSSADIPAVRPHSAQNLLLLEAWASKSLLTLPGLANSAAISNGNFARGLVDFHSDYILTDNPDTFMGAGSATLTTWAPNWGFATRSGPSGAGSPFMLFDGATNPDTIVWSTTVTGLRQGATYTFDLSMLTGTENTSRLQLYLNGVAIGNILTATASEGWAKRSVTFMAPQNDRDLYFEIRNLTTGASGNDFGLGNISIQATEPGPGVIRNGGFELGATGFASDYQNRFASDYTGSRKGTYAIVSRFDKLPSLWDIKLANPAEGVNDIIWISGGDSAKRYFWKQDLTGLTAGDEYLFSFRMLASDLNPAKIKLDINGAPHAQTWSASEAEGWVTHHTYIKVPDGSNHLELGLRNLTTDAAGNDFAIDDVSIYNVTNSVASIQNGDFDDANTGFSSDYTYTDGKNYQAGSYAIVKKAPAWGLGASESRDGSGAFLMVDGGRDASKHFWKTSIKNLKPGDEYIFRFRMMANDLNGAKLKLDVNGVEQGVTWSAKRSDGWTSQTLKIKVPDNSTQLDLGLRDLTTTADGNDFGIDDISLTRNLQPSTDEGVSKNWVRGVRLLHAQSVDEIGDVTNLTTYQRYLLANNVFGIDVLGNMPAAMIGRLPPDFFNHATTALVQAWARADRLSALTSVQAQALPMNVVLDLVTGPLESKLSVAARSGLYQKTAGYLETIDWSSAAAIDPARLSVELFKSMGQKALDRLKSSKAFDRLPVASREAIDKQLELIAEERKNDEHYTGLTAAASTFSSLSSSDLDSIKPGTSDDDIRKILDLKIPNWSMWSFSGPYFTSTVGLVYLLKWMVDLNAQNSSIKKIWINGLSTIELNISGVADPAVKARLMSKYLVLKAASTEFTGLTDSLGASLTLYQNLRFYSSIYRVISAAGVLGTDLQKEGQTSEALGMTALRLAQVVVSALQVPTSFITQSVINKSVPGSDLYKVSSWDDFARYWKSKGLFSTLAATYDLRTDLNRAAWSGSSIRAHQNAVQQLKADFERFTIGSTHHSYVNLKVVADSIHDVVKSSGGSKGLNIARSALPNLVFQCSDFGGIAIVIWNIVNLSNDFSSKKLTEVEKAQKALSLVQQIMSVTAISIYVVGDAAGFAGTLVKLGKLPIQASKVAAVEAGGLQAGSAIGLAANLIDYILQGLAITKDNVLSPVLGLVQSGIYICLDMLSLMFPVTGLFSMLFQLLMPNMQAAIISDTMNDRLKLLDDVGSMTGANPSKYREENIEGGYLASCSPFKAIKMLQKSQFDQMLAAAMPLGSIAGPIALAAATTTLKNRIHYEPDFTDGPGNFHRAIENFTKTVLAETAIFNLLTSGVQYREGMSGLLDWTHYWQDGGGRASIQNKLKSLADLYTYNFQFILSVASGESATFPDGNPIGKEKFALLSDLGLYSGSIRQSAPTHMYHTSWDLNSIKMLDLFAAASRTADIDANINPYAINILGVGLAGESLGLTTHPEAQVNIEFIESPITTIRKVQDLYLGEGNFNIHVRENLKTAFYTRLHAGTGYNTLEGAHEMFGNDESDSVFLVNAATQWVHGGARKGDLLGISQSVDLISAKITDNTLSFSARYNEEFINTSTTTYDKINNFIISEPTSRIDLFRNAAADNVSLLLAGHTDQLNIHHGLVAVSTAPNIEGSKIVFHEIGGEVALNNMGNHVSFGGRLFPAENKVEGREYVASTVVGNLFDAFYAPADTYFEIRPLNSLAANSSADPTLKILGTNMAANVFSFDLDQLKTIEKPIQLVISGNNSWRDPFLSNDIYIDRLELFKSDPTSESAYTVKDISYFFETTTNRSHGFIDKSVNVFDQVMKVNLGDKTVAEIYSVQDSSYIRYSKARLDIYFDNNLLAQTTIG